MNFSNYYSLIDFLNSTLQADYPEQSRVHRLQSFDTEYCRCYIKRDDELGFGISGSKIRKYRSLIPFLLTEKIEEVVVIGGAYSNHVVGITQLLIENRIIPTLFLRKSRSNELKGNALLLSWFVENASIHWIDGEQWPEVENLAHDYSKNEEAKGKKVFVLNEGGSQPQALPGALSLPIDIIRNEKKLGIKFDHIFIEAGTGMMASALILGMNWIGHLSLIHVLLLAGTEQTFMKELKKFHQSFELITGTQNPMPVNFNIHFPKNAPAFGSVNKRTFQEIKSIARNEGFLCDPIYSAKLMIESQRVIKEGKMEGNILSIHSGGGLSLLGFI